MEKRIKRPAAFQPKAVWALWVFFLLALLTTRGFTQEAKKITLFQAIEMAQRVNPGLIQSANQVSLKQINVSQKKANFLPSVNLSAHSTQTFDKTLDSVSQTFAGDHHQNLNLSLSSSLNLFNGFYDRSALEQSKFKLQAEKEYYKRSEQSIVFETIQRYVQVILSEELIQVDKNNLQAQKVQLIRIEEFFKAGRRPVSDLYQQKAEISRYEYQLLNSERNFQINRLELLQTLGFKLDPDCRFINPGIEDLIESIKEFNHHTVLARALTERPDVKAQKKQIAAAGKDITAARAGFWPNLTLQVSIGSSYTSIIEPYNFTDQLFENNPNASFGLTLSIPVFDKSTTRNNVATARINLKNQQLELEKLTHQVNVEVKKAIEDYNTAKKQVDVAKYQEQYSKAALESVQGRYNVNAATMSELIQARSQHFQSQYSLVEAKFNLLIRGIAVAFYQGDGDGMIAFLKTDHK